MYMYSMCVQYTYIYVCVCMCTMYMYMYVCVCVSDIAGACGHRYCGGQHHQHVLRPHDLQGEPHTWKYMCIAH